MWPWGKKQTPEEAKREAERARPGWIDQPEEEEGYRANRNTPPSKISQAISSMTPTIPKFGGNEEGRAKSDDGTWLNKLPFFGNNDDSSAQDGGRNINDTRRPTSFMDKSFKNQSREEYEMRKQAHEIPEEQDDYEQGLVRRDELLFNAADQVRQIKHKREESQLAKHLGTSQSSSSSIRRNFNTPSGPPGDDNNMHPEVRFAHHIKSRGTQEEEKEQKIRDKDNAQFFDSQGRFNPTKDITKRYMNYGLPDGEEINPKIVKKDLYSRDENMGSFPSTADPRLSVYGQGVKLTPEIRQRVEKLEDEIYQDDADADHALWRQKERVKDKQLQQYAADNGLDVNELRANYKSNKTFHRFDVGEDKIVKPMDLYRTDIDGNQTGYTSNALLIGVPGQNDGNNNGKKIIRNNNNNNNDKYQEEENVNQERLFEKLEIKQGDLIIPSNYVVSGNLITNVIPPQQITPKDYKKLTEENKKKYQQQQIDYQRWVFQQLSERQQELMLLAQWDKLSEPQQVESLEFQYLHLDQNIRRKVKLFPNEEQKNTFLREKHFEQQRIFLTSPISYSNEQLQKDLYDKEWKKKSPAFNEKRRGKKSRQDDVIKKEQGASSGDEGDYDDYDDDLEALEELRGLPIEERKKLLHQAVDKFNAFRREKYGETPQDIKEKELYQDITDKDFIKLQQDLRNMSPQQQFTFLFRQHETQRLELEKYQEQQLQRFTHQLMKKQFDKDPNIKITAENLLQMNEMRSIRKQHQDEKDLLRKKQQEEHEQLTKFLLHKQELEQKYPNKIINTIDGARIIPQHLNPHEIEIEKMRNELYKDLDDKRLLREKLTLQWDLDEQLQSELGISKDTLRRLDQIYDETINESDIEPTEEEFKEDMDDFKKRLDKFRPKNTPEPISLEDARLIIIRKEKEKKFDHEQYKKQLEMNQHIERLREKRNNMLLSLPISQEIIELHHPIVRDRLHNKTAAKIYKLTSMLLFGVNVRWNGGIVNGLYTKLTPPIPADLLDKERQKDPTITPDILLKKLGFKPIYLDIEHRQLNFNNLVNYYGVAASIYDSDVMPIYSHRLYEDPDLNPFDHPNIAPLERYELLLEVQRRAKLFQAKSINELNDNSDTIDDELERLDDNGPLGEGVGDLHNAEERDVTKLKTKELISIVNNLYKDPKGNNNNNDSDNDNNNFQTNSINPMLLPYNDEIEIVKDTKTYTKIGHDSPDRTRLMDNPEAMRQAIIEYQDRLRQEYQSDENLQYLKNIDDPFEMQKVDNYFKDKGLTWMGADIEEKKKLMKEEEERQEKLKIEQEKRKVRELELEKEKELKRQQKEEERNKQQLEREKQRMGGAVFAVEKRSSQDQVNNKGIGKEKTFYQDYADWDGDDRGVGYRQAAQQQTPQYSRRNVPIQKQSDFLHSQHVPTDEEDNLAMMNTYQQREDYTKRIREEQDQSFGSWNETITDIEDSRSGFKADSNKFLTYTQPNRFGKDKGPDVVYPLVHLKEGKTDQDFRWETDSDIDQDRENQAFDKAQYDPQDALRRNMLYGFLPDEEPKNQQQQQEPKEEKGWFGKLWG